MKIDQIPFEAHSSPLIEHQNPEMSWSICHQSKCPHGRINNHVDNHIKSNNNEDADELTYHVVVQACKFVSLAAILMLGDDNGSLAERKTNGGVVNSKPKTKRVLNRDKI